MDISLIANELGISYYPKNFADFCKSSAPVSILDRENIEFLDSEYRVFGKYKTAIFECIELIEENAALSVWGAYAAAYMRVATIEDAKHIAVPIISEDSPLRYYPLLVIAAALPYGIEKYRARGFSEDEIKNLLFPAVIERIEKAERDNGKRGLDMLCYGWLRNYAIASVFRAGAFNITPKFFDEKNVILKNKNTGEIIPLAVGAFHRTGMVLGSFGFTDTDGAFTADFCETEDSYIGYPAIDSHTSGKAVVFPKSEWEILLKSGDGFGGIHIPVGCDLSEENIKKSYELALRITRERYPEYNAKALACSSWMLDPHLTELLGESSRISGFLRTFTKYPTKSNGKNIFRFVFPRKYESYAELPEDTSLQRKIKELYINGGAIHVYSGIVTGIY